MKLRAVEVAGSVCPAFDEDGPDAWLRAGFLRDTQGHADEILALITQARREPEASEPSSWANNEVWLSFHPIGVVITHQWIFGNDGIEREIVIPLDEAESLLRAWEREVVAFSQLKRRRGW